MIKAKCPYLGLKDDPTTALNFPSEGNFCHHAKPVAPVNRANQQQYCLASEHTTCPVFQAEQLQPLPPAFTATTPRAPARRILGILGIPVLLAGAIALGFAVIGLGNANLPVRYAGGSDAWSLLETNVPTAPSISPTPSPSNKPQDVNCPNAGGWVPYVVNPTDSLYSLSLIYGVSVEELRKTNCLDGNTGIFPGQVISVPLLNSDLFTPTPTPVANTLTYSGQPQNNDPVVIPPANTPVPPANTPVPPTPKPVVNPVSNQQNQVNNKNNGNGHGHGNGNGNGNGKSKGKGKGKGK